MNVRFPKPGTYVLAVSGGVDSVALLDMLAKQSDLKLIVAHFDHHIRVDSTKDAKLVQELSTKYELPFELGEERLGPSASEAEARNARYKFLRTIISKYDAKAIITAHHEDDFIETAILNVIRGTGPRGVTAMASNSAVLRPLLGVKKTELIDYALKNGLAWREDSTNTDENIIRNYLRLNILSKMTEEQRGDLLKKINKVAEVEGVKESLIATLSHSLLDEQGIDRSRFSLMPFDVGSSLLHDWLKNAGAAELNRRLIVRLNNFVRTGGAGSDFDVDKRIKVTLTKEVAKLTNKT